MLSRYGLIPKKQTVKTVPHLLMHFLTGLKPGVNERPDLAF